MMIRNYQQLNDREILEMQRHYQNRPLPDLKKEIETKMYHYGEGVFFCFQGSRITGSVRVVLEVVKHLNTGYIHCFSLSTDAEEKEQIIKELLEAALGLLREKECGTILLGSREEEIQKILASLGYPRQYQAFKLKLDDRKTSGKIYSLVPLTQENKIQYQFILNQSFSDMPHGSYLEESELEEYLNDQKDNRYYMVSDGEQIIGFINTEVSEGTGSFDIGLCPQFRGQGKGKILLETAIDALNRQKTGQIIITVIEINRTAFAMYQKRGFYINSVLSDWTRIQ